MTAIVILTKNEEKTISQLIDDLNSVLKTLPSFNFKLFLCDDSTDKTQEIARSKKLNIISGKGSLGWSYYFALSYLSKFSFEKIITLDGDGQTDLSEIPIFLEELNKGFDLAVGSRFLTPSSISYSYSKWNFVGVKILSSIISFSTGQKFTDSHGGLRAMKSRVIKNIPFLGTHSYVQETIISIKSQGFKVKELPSKWNKRLYGESRVVRSKLKYIKAMAFPLLLRMRMHLIFFIVCLVFYLLSFSDIDYFYTDPPLPSTSVVDTNTSPALVADTDTHVDMSHSRESGNLLLSVLFNLFQKNFYLILALFFGSFEFYKNYLYNKNKQKIKNWINAK